MSLFKYIVAILVLAAAVYLFYSFTKKKEQEKLSQNVEVLESQLESDDALESDVFTKS
jgi:hypothetical protein